MSIFKSKKKNTLTIKSINVNKQYSSININGKYELNTLYLFNRNKDPNSGKTGLLVTNAAGFENIRMDGLESLFSYRVFVLIRLIDTKQIYSYNPYDNMFIQLCFDAAALKKEIYMIKNEIYVSKKKEKCNE